MLLMYNYVLLKMSTWYSKHVEESNNILRINNIQCITLVILYGLILQFSVPTSKSQVFICCCILQAGDPNVVSKKCNSVHCCLWLFCKERNLATSTDYVCSYLLSPLLFEVGLDCWCGSKACSCRVSWSHAPLHCLVQIFLLTPQQPSAPNSFNYNRRLDSTLIVLCKAAGLLQRFVEVSSLSAVTNRSYVYKKILGVHTLCHTPQWCFH